MQELVEQTGADPHMRDRVPSPGAARARVIAIASGRAGVGKTNIATNLGVALAARGQRVCILDADGRPANLRALLGYTPRRSLENLVSDPDCNLDEVLATGPSGTRVLPLASVIADYVSLDAEQRDRLTGALEELESRFDYILVDTAAGVRNTVLQFLNAVQHVLMVITPDPRTLSAAFALLKALRRQGSVRPIHVLVNMVPAAESGRELFRKFGGTVEKYLKLRVGYLGQIPEDETVTSSVELQRPVVLLKHRAPASRGFYDLAEDLIRIVGDRPLGHQFSAYWRNVPKIAEPGPPTGQTGEFLRPAFPIGGQQPPPQQPAAPSPQPLSRRALADAAVKLIAEPATRGREAEELLVPIITAFTERFQRYPLDLKDALLRALEMRDYPGPEVREMVDALETRYEGRHGRPLSSAHTRAIRLFAQVKDSREEIEDLVQRLTGLYRNRYGQDPVDPLESVVKNIKAGLYSTDQLSELKNAVVKSVGGSNLSENDALAVLAPLRPLVESVYDRQAALHDALLELLEALPEPEPATEPPPEEDEENLEDEIIDDDDFEDEAGSASH